jgi:MFS family permease
VAVRTSLKTAIYWSTGIVLSCLLVIWWLLRFEFPWMLYVLSIWVSLFSIILVSQAWLVAANVFNSREAKRLYGLLGLGAVIGAALGGEFTALVARMVETRHLLLASGVMVLLAFGALMIVASQKNVNLAAAKGAEAEQEFAFKDILEGIRKHKHLQVIMGIITLMFIVDVLIDYQFSALAKLAYPRKEDLTAFLGSFFGIYLNLVTFVLQFFLTAVIVRHMGVGGTLQIMPVVIGATSLCLIAVPQLAIASVVRILEAGTRYTLNKTGMELLYLPLPADLKNRTKAFVDIFIDRFGRGIGGLVLMAFSALFVASGQQPQTRQVAWLVIGFSLLWIFLSVLASREYVATIRRRLASRRLDLSEVHLAAADAGTIELLERQLTEGTPRQAAYALGLLADAAQYEIAPVLHCLVESPHAEVRKKVFEVASAASYADLREQARRAVESAGDSSEQKSALAYLLSTSADSIITDQWIAQAAAAPDPRRRALAAHAIQLRAVDPGAQLRRLLEDPDPQVLQAACRAAGALGDRRHFDGLVRRLANYAVRGAATESLASFGPRICGALGDILLDPRSPLAIRCRVPRVLRLIRDQRSVDVLLASLDAPDDPVSSAVLKALNRLREAAPALDFKSAALAPRLTREARRYFDLGAQLDPLASRRTPQTAASLLVKSIEVRMARIEDRLFRLLALRYPPAEMYSAYLAVRSRHPEKVTVALDYLDSTLDRDWKRFILPLFDGPARVVKNGRDLFRLEPQSAETAVRALVGSPDAWLSACAMAAAAELKLQAVLPEIERAGALGGPENAAVARASAAALA